MTQKRQTNARDQRQHQAQHQPCDRLRPTTERGCGCRNIKRRHVETTSGRTIPQAQTLFLQHCHAARCNRRRSFGRIGIDDQRKHPVFAFDIEGGLHNVGFNRQAAILRHPRAHRFGKQPRAYNRGQIIHNKLRTLPRIINVHIGQNLVAADRAVSHRHLRRHAIPRRIGAQFKQRQQQNQQRHSQHQPPMPLYYREIPSKFHISFQT